MKIKVNDIDIHFDMEGSGKNIILLHGWGANRYTWNNISVHLSENYRVFKIDLPGFGQTTINESLTIDDNVKLIKGFCDVFNIESPIIIAHSYGGRIAIKYASLYKVEKLILVASAGIKPRLKISKKIKIKVYKFLKKCHVNINMGSKDYKDASPILKKMLVMAVNQDLSQELEKIKYPTLLVWGENDNSTPVADAKKMNQLIKNSGLVVIDKCGHFPYLERSSYFKIVVDSFLGSDTSA